MRVESPYFVAAFIFAIILVAGRWFWHWGDMETAFLVLFFLLVAIGIRLDDIVKKMGATNERLDRLLGKNDTGSPPVQPTPIPDFRHGPPEKEADLAKKDD